MGICFCTENLRLKVRSHLPFISIGNFLRGWKTSPLRFRKGFNLAAQIHHWQKVAWFESDFCAFCIIDNTQWTFFACVTLLKFGKCDRALTLVLEEKVTSDGNLTWSQNMLDTLTRITCYKVLWLHQLYMNICYTIIHFFYHIVMHLIFITKYWRTLYFDLLVLTLRMCVYELLQMWWKKWINAVKMASRKHCPSVFSICLFCIFKVLMCWGMFAV